MREFGVKFLLPLSTQNLIFQNPCIAHPQRKFWSVLKCSMLKDSPVFRRCHAQVPVEDFYKRYNRVILLLGIIAWFRKNAASNFSQSKIVFIFLPIYLLRCVFDACACDQGGDCECLCTSFAAYTQECNAKGVILKWRSQDLCRKYFDLVIIICFQKRDFIPIVSESVIYKTG